MNILIKKNITQKGGGCFIIKNLFKRYNHVNQNNENINNNNNNVQNHLKLIFSGIQPTSIPHIGNYFGAIKPWVDLQNNNENIIISIVDLHAITAPKDPKILSDYIHKCAASLISCGINPSKTLLFQQSRVPYHGQLSWILGCYSTMTQLSHMHQFKWKSNGVAEVPLGLFSYPVLQAADILLYKATDVPIGEDQLQHLELCRTIARKFNNFHKVDYFPLPKSIDNEFKKLRSLRDPSKKMSKSDKDSKSRIELMDPPEIIREKIKKAVTDALPYIAYKPEERVGVANLIDIHCACTNKLPEEITEECILQALNKSSYKLIVAEALIEHLKPIRKKYLQLMEDKDYLNKIIDESTLKANEIAEKNFKEIRKIVGFDF